MLEHYSNQASGLLGLGSQQGPRLIAMVSHGDERAELPLLWQLCLSLVNFGYSVTVLDATTPESEDNPGLAQLLGNTLWRDEGARDIPAWTVLPSTTGIRSLCNAQGASVRSLHQLRHLFPIEGVVVLYCSADSMASLLHDWPIEPLLAVSPVQASLLTGYTALKRLLITGKLKPTIINMLQDSDMDLHQPLTSGSATAGLSECAKRFLGYEFKTLDIREQHGESQPRGEVQGLALRLLESAVTLGAPAAAGRTAVHRPVPLRRFDQFAGGH